jgi:cell wall assembly regulator SMI1
MVSFEDSNKPKLTEANLRRTENDLGFLFPSDYRRFLLEFNGGKPTPNMLVIPGNDEEVAIESFLGIGRRDLDLNIWTPELRHSLDMPKEYIPIAFDPGGNNLIMTSAQCGDSEIYYWDSGRHFDFSTDEENAFFIADSFAELLTKFNVGR